MSKQIPPNILTGGFIIRNEGTDPKKSLLGNSVHHSALGTSLYLELFEKLPSWVTGDMVMSGGAQSKGH